MCNVIADEGSWAETSYIDVILYAMSIKCSKELFSYNSYKYIAGAPAPINDL